LRRPPLCDLKQVDPSLLTQRGSGSQEPGENQQEDGLDASGDSGSCACSRRQSRLPWLKGDSGRNGHYCTVPQVVRVSPGRESGAKRNLGVWAPAARCGNICSSPQVRDYQVRERSAPIPQQQTSASPSARTELRGLKVQKEGRFATHETAKKLGCMRPPPVRLGQVSEKGRVNRDSTSQILSVKPRSS